MAYLLKDIMLDKSHVISNNDIDYTQWSSHKTLPHSSSVGKMIFETYNITHGGDSLLSFSSNPNSEGFTSSVSLCIDTIPNGKLLGYTTGCGIITNNTSNYNNIDYFHHTIVDYKSKTVTLINAMTGMIYKVINIAGYIDNYIKTGPAYIGFIAGIKTINPDVPSFKYRPTVEVETDLYSHILGLPYIPPVYTPKNSKPIISLF